jgi:hypothetical protein
MGLFPKRAWCFVKPDILPQTNMVFTSARRIRCPETKKSWQAEKVVAKRSLSKKSRGRHRKSWQAQKVVANFAAPRH